MCENCTNAIVPLTANIVAIMYSVTQSNVVGRVHTASIIATAHEHAAIVSMRMISINLLIMLLFRLIIKKRLPFVYTLGGITQHVLLHVLIRNRHSYHRYGMIITNVMILYILCELRIRKCFSDAVVQLAVAVVPATIAITCRKTKLILHHFYL